MSALRGRPVSRRSARCDHLPHAAAAGAIDFDMLRQRWPGHRRVDVAKGGTAHVLFVRIENLSRTNVPDNNWQVRLTWFAVKRIFLSSREDRCYPAGRVGD